MRTNIVLDDALVAEAMSVSGAKTKRDAVDLALREYVAGHRQRALKRLVGRGLIAADYDVRAVRKAKARGAG